MRGHEQDPEIRLIRLMVLTASYIEFRRVRAEATSKRFDTGKACYSNYQEGRGGTISIRLKMVEDS
jgi:hypothetical protein